MRNMKKFLALALAATMTVTMVPATAFAYSNVVVDPDAATQTAGVKDAKDYEDAVKKTAAAVEAAGFSSDDTKKADFLTTVQKAANANGLAVEQGDITVTPASSVKVDPKTYATVFPTVTVTMVPSNLNSIGYSVAKRTVSFTVTATKLTVGEKTEVVRQLTNLTINNTLFSNDTDADDFAQAINAGLAKNNEAKGTKVDTVDYFHVNQYGATSEKDGYIHAKVSFKLKSIVATPKTESGNQLYEADQKTPIYDYVEKTDPLTVETIYGKGGEPLTDEVGDTNITGLKRSRFDMIDATDYAYARIPYGGFTVNGAGWAAVEEYLAGLDFYNDGFNDSSDKSFRKAVEDALYTAGSPLLLQNRALAVKVQYTTKKATHDENGSARVLITVKESSDPNSQNAVTVPVDITLKHSPAEIKQEILTDVDSAADLSALQPKNSTKAASAADIKAAIEKDIADKLAKAPAGFTKPYSNDLDTSVPFEIQNFVYTPATFYRSGKVSYKVVYSLPKQKGKYTAFDGKKLTVTLPKLKKVCSDGITIDDITIRKGVNKVIDVKFSSDDVTDKLVYIAPAKNAVKGVAQLYYVPAILDDGTVYNPSYKEGLKTVSVNTTSSKGAWSDEWGVRALGVGTTAFDAYYINEDTQKTYHTTFTVTVTKGFIDVDNENAYYYNAVYQLNERGLLAGVSDTEYAPYKSVTRAQFVSFLYRLAENRYHKSHTDFGDYTGETPFADVKKGAYYAKAVEWAVKTGVTAGKSATAFDPNGTVTRAEAVTFLYNYMGKGSVYNASNEFGDVPAGKFYTEAVNWAVANKITAGKTATMFAPGDPVTRAQAAVFVWNIFNADNAEKEVLTFNDKNSRWIPLYE